MAAFFARLLASELIDALPELPDENEKLMKLGSLEDLYLAELKDRGRHQGRIQ